MMEVRARMAEDFMVDKWAGFVGWRRKGLNSWYLGSLGCCWFPGERFRDMMSWNGKQHKEQSPFYIPLVDSPS